MTDWTSGYVSANGVSLHFTRTGGEKPPLVLAHGVTDDGLCWTPVVERLAKTYDAIMVDARGHGLSEATEQGYDPATQAADLAGLIGGLGLRRPAVLGHSMGAATALVLAGTYPDLPGAILLEDPPPWWVVAEPTPALESRRAEGRARALEIREMSREHLLAETRERHPQWPDGEFEPWADSKFRFSPNVLTVYGDDNSRAVDWGATLSRITCPALLIIADTELGGIVSESDAAALKALVPHLEIAHVPDAGHSIRRDQFASYLAVIAPFLACYAGMAG
ncbi:MAG: alpha/beta hydrolase [Thermomicrobiales bacterium]